MTPGDGTIRCVIGQSSVGENADVTAAGVPYGAGTGAYRDYYCVNVDYTYPLVWFSIDAQATLYKGNGYCTGTARVGTLSNRQIQSNSSYYCGPGGYFTLGTHGAQRNLQDVPRRELTATPTVLIGPH